MPDEVIVCLSESSADTRWPRIDCISQLYMRGNTPSSENTDLSKTTFHGALTC
jgi:hypothetical protein